MALLRKRGLWGAVDVIRYSQRKGRCGRALRVFWAGHKPRHLSRHRGEGGPVRAVRGVSQALPWGVTEAGQGVGDRPPWTGAVRAAPRAPLLGPVIGRAGWGGWGEGASGWKLRSTPCRQLWSLFSASLGNRRQGLCRTQSLSGRQGGGAGVLPSGAAGREGGREFSWVAEPCVSRLPTQASVSAQTRRPLSGPAPQSTSPCPGRGCWCAAAWMDQTARRWHCLGHLVGIGAGCCARWDPPSRTRALATLQGEKGLWARKSPFCLA